MITWIVIGLGIWFIILKSTQNFSKNSEKAVTVRKKTILGGALLVFSFIRSPGDPCYWKTTLLSLVSSGHILYKGPLRVVHLSPRVAQTARRPHQISFAPLSFRCMRSESCFHWNGQESQCFSIRYVVQLRRLPFQTLMLDRCLQGRVRTKSGSS